MEANRGLTAIENALHEAVATETLAQAGRLIEEYVSEIERQVRTFPPGSRQILDLEGRVCHLLEWVGIMVRGTREHASIEIRRLRSISSYSEPARPSHLVQDRA
jgi:hypothetical protein